MKTFKQYLIEATRNEDIEKLNSSTKHKWKEEYGAVYTAYDVKGNSKFRDGSGYDVAHLNIKFPHADEKFYTIQSSNSHLDMYKSKNLDDIIKIISKFDKEGY